MQRLDEKAFENFKELYDCVNTSFVKMRQKAEEKLRRLETSIQWHFYLVVPVVFVSWFFGPGSFIMTPIKELIQANGVSVDGMFFFFLLLFGFAGWVIVVMLISAPVYRRTTRKSDAAKDESGAHNAAHDSPHPWIMSGLLLIYSVVILPALPFLLILGPSLAVGANTTSILLSYVLSAAISLVAWLLMFGLMTMVSGGVSHILFMLLSSVSRGEDGALIPGYINMVQGAARQVVAKEKFNNLTANDWQHIGIIARWKLDGVNGQVQAFSFGVGALGLLSLFTLVQSEDEIRAEWERFWITLAELLGIGSTGSALVGATLSLGILFVIWLLGYFARSYIELRILEAMGVICSLAASGSADQQRSAPTPPSAPLPAPAPPDAAPSPGAAATVVPVASVASGNTSDAAQSVGDSSSSAAAPPPCSAPGNKASGDAAPSASTAGASARSSGEPLNAAPSADGQAVAPAEGSPPCAAPASGTPDAAQLPGDSLSNVADTPASSDVLGDPPAHADHRS